MTLDRLVQIRMPGELVERLDALALVRGKTRSDLIRALIETWVAAKGKKA